jgi:hypothetical protein
MIHSFKIGFSEKMSVHFVMSSDNLGILSGGVSIGISSGISILTRELRIILWRFHTNIRLSLMSFPVMRLLNFRMYTDLWKSFMEWKTIFRLLVKHLRIVVSNTIIYTSSQGSSRENISGKCSRIKDFRSRKISISRKKWINSNFSLEYLHENPLRHRRL